MIVESCVTEIMKIVVDNIKKYTYIIEQMEYIIEYVENHSLFFGLIASVLSIEFYGRRTIQQKRAEAFYSFYAKLLLYTKELRMILNDEGQLEVDHPESGNIYSLIYEETSRRNYCPSYHELKADYMKRCKDISQNISRLLTETDNNVFPRNANRKKWYNSEHALYSFSGFLTNEDFQGCTNKQYEDKDDEKNKIPVHVKKCKHVLDAMDYIEKSINNAKY